MRLVLKTTPLLCPPALVYSYELTNATGKGMQDVMLTTSLVFKSRRLETEIQHQKGVMYESIPTAGTPPPLPPSLLRAFDSSSAPPRRAFDAKQDRPLGHLTLRNELKGFRNLRLCLPALRLWSDCVIHAVVL